MHLIVVAVAVCRCSAPDAVLCVLAPVPRPPAEAGRGGLIDRTDATEPDAIRAGMGWRCERTTLSAQGKCDNPFKSIINTWSYIYIAEDKCHLVRALGWGEDFPNKHWGFASLSLSLSASLLSFALAEFIFYDVEGLWVSALRRSLLHVTLRIH